MPSQQDRTSSETSSHSDNNSSEASLESGSYESLSQSEDSVLENMMQFLNIGLMPTRSEVSQVYGLNRETLCVREFLSTRSVVSYGKDKYVPLHVFLDMFNQFCDERNFHRFPLFQGWLDEVLRHLTKDIVFIDFEVCDEEWPIGSQRFGRSVFVRNIGLNSVHEDSDMEDDSEVSETCSESSEVSTYGSESGSEQTEEESGSDEGSDDSN